MLCCMCAVQGLLSQICDARRCVAKTGCKGVKASFGLQIWGELLTAPTHTGCLATQMALLPLQHLVVSTGRTIFYLFNHKAGCFLSCMHVCCSCKDTGQLQLRGQIGEWHRESAAADTTMHVCGTCATLLLWSVVHTSTPQFTIMTQNCGMNCPYLCLFQRDHNVPKGQWCCCHRQVAAC